MNKNFVISMSAFLMCASLVLGPTKAEAHFPEFTDLYTVGSGSPDEVAKDTFGWDETPYLFMHLSESDADFVVSFWQDPDDVSTGVTEVGGTDPKRWVSLDGWDSIKKVGEWNIDAAWFKSSNGHSATGSTSFTVTPEPLAMTLFLIGGAPIAASLIRKRKNRVKV